MSAHSAPDFSGIDALLRNARLLWRNSWRRPATHARIGAPLPHASHSQDMSSGSRTERITGLSVTSSLPTPRRVHPGGPRISSDHPACASVNVPRETLVSSNVMHTNHRQIHPSTASTRELFGLDSANDPQSTVRTLGVVSTAARRVDRQPARHGAHAGPTDAALFCVCAARSHPTSASDVQTARCSPIRITEGIGRPRPLRAISGCGWLVGERVQPSCSPCSRASSDLLIPRTMTPTSLSEWTPVHHSAVASPARSLTANDRPTTPHVSRETPGPSILMS